MSSIFDSMQDNVGGVAGQNPEGEGYFTLEFGVETVDVPVGKFRTVADAFRSNSTALGFRYDDSLTFRSDSNDIMEGGESPVAGSTYTAAITHNTKG